MSVERFLGLLRRFKNDARTGRLDLPAPVNRSRDGVEQHSLDGGDTWHDGPVPPWPWPEEPE